MAQNLKQRLTRIRGNCGGAESGAASGGEAWMGEIRAAGNCAAQIRAARGTVAETCTAAKGGFLHGKPERAGTEGEAPWPGWVNAGFKTLKREFVSRLSLPLPSAFPRPLPIVVPDIFRFGSVPSPADLLFFDLETSGLSGGAGTLAFLAAFGRFAVSPDTSVGAEKRNSGGFTDAGLNTPGNSASGDTESRTGEEMATREAMPDSGTAHCGKAGAVASGARLHITQYLLLDYPGENDFIESVVKEFSPRDGGGLPLVVSFNGKSFDSQILRNRCLMNGVMTPQYFHADLLHPARRLWKRLLPDCSQTTVETSVLRLDRSGDVPGALAPEIWFSFLKTGDARGLFSICDHNTKDITGLAEIFLALGEIAAEPIKSRARFRFDEEAPALFWRKALKQNPLFFDDDERKTGRLLLETAAGNGCPRAALVLAKDAEWRAKDFNAALRYTRLALAAVEIPESLRENLEGRRSRLEKKIAPPS